VYLHLCWRFAVARFLADGTRPETPTLS
jgi:hypothetical protein